MGWGVFPPTHTRLARARIHTHTNTHARTHAPKLDPPMLQPLTLRSRADLRHGPPHGGHRSSCCSRVSSRDSTPVTVPRGAQQPPGLRRLAQPPEEEATTKGGGDRSARRALPAAAEGAALRGAELGARCPRRRGGGRVGAGIARARSRAAAAAQRGRRERGGDSPWVPTAPHPDSGPTIPTWG